MYVFLLLYLYATDASIISFINFSIAGLGLGIR